MSFDRAQAERLAQEAADGVKEVARRFAAGLEELIEQAALEVRRAGMCMKNKRFEGFLVVFCHLLVASGSFLGL